MIGAAYAAGMSGKAIRRHVIRVVHDRADLIRRLLGARAAPWSSFLRRPLGQNPVLLDGDRLCAAFLPHEVPDDFAKLPIPLLLVASDLFTREEIVFKEGPLRPAIAASMAIPGLVRPVEHGGRVLVDGAAVDPLPFTPACRVGPMSWWRSIARPARWPAAPCPIRGTPCSPPSP